MTREEWLATSSPHELMEAVRQAGGLCWRQSRLACCAFARWHLGRFAPFRLGRHAPFHGRVTSALAVARGTLDAAEAFALHPAAAGRPPEELRRLAHEAERHAEGIFRSLPAGGPGFHGMDADDPSVIALDAVAHAAKAAGMLPCNLVVPAEKAALAADALRDVMGWPGRPKGPAVPAAAWASLRPLVLAASGERREGLLDPLRLAVLSDALEEAGCADGGLLAHLRSPGPHYAGCWAVFDLLRLKPAAGKGGLGW